jgi:hypothetical protein
MHGATRCASQAPVTKKTKKQDAFDLTFVFSEHKIDDMLLSCRLEAVDENVKVGLAFTRQNLQEFPDALKRMRTLLFDDKTLRLTDATFGIQLTDESAVQIDQLYQGVPLGSKSLDDFVIQGHQFSVSAIPQL